jgi:hypothetical protein
VTPRGRAGLVLLAALAFGISPVFTEGFKGYDKTQFPVLIADPAILPAGYAFAIWGLIYLWLFAHAGFGLWKRADDPAWDATRLPLLGSLAIGAIWLAVAVRSPLWASVLITLMAAGALVALARAPARPDRWLLLAPLAIYAGWLSAATGVSWGVLLAGFGWLPDTGAALLMLTLVLGLVLTMQLWLRRAPEYGLTVIWALAAVIVRSGGDNPVVSGFAALGILLIGAAVLRIGRKAASARRAGASSRAIP